MARLSTKSVLILAAVCFIGLVALQAAWLESAYAGEVALIEKARKQFERDLQSELGQQAAVRDGLQGLLGDYARNGRLSAEHVEWFHMALVPAIEGSRSRGKYAVYLDGISIAATKQGPKGADVSIIAGERIETPAPSEVAHAGKLCLDCLSGADTAAGGPRFQLLLFYRDERSVLLEKQAVLIIASFVFLILLGALFRQVLNKYRQEKRLSEAKNDFINNLSHELQTPVFAIQMANRLIKEKGTSVPALAPLVDVIEKEAGQLKQHARKILELASLESGQVELEPELTALNAFVAAKQETIGLMLQAKKGVLELKLHPGELLTMVDTVHLNNMLMTLVDNAIKYSRETLLLTIGTGEAGRFVTLNVTDNGIGISRAFLTLVTSKFYRVPLANRSSIPGFGLGLNYVRQVAEQHGGALKLSSEPGVGTTVTILLPKASADA